MSSEDTIEALLGLKSAAEALPQPVFFNLRDQQDQQHLQQLFDRESVVIRDPLEEQLLELTIARNPSLLPLDAAFAEAFEAIKKELLGTQPTAHIGVWVYLPWRRVLTHLLDQELYLELQTAYNREIITTEEQVRFRAGHLGIAGLSTGNNVALAVILQRGCQHMRLADSDILELASMNRIRAGIDAIGELKTTITAKQIYELDPFAELELFPDGLTDDNMTRFMVGPPKLNVLVDTVDSVRAKALIRFAAKEHRIPVISTINNGNDVLLDVERYDTDPTLTPFNGGLGQIDENFLAEHDKMTPQAQVRLAAQLMSGRAKRPEQNILQEKMRPDEQARLLIRLIGPPNIAPRLQRSLLVAGKQIFSWPQVSNAVLVSCGVAALAVRRILLEEKLDSGRYPVSVEGIFDAAYDSQSARTQRLQETQDFLQSVATK